MERPGQEYWSGLLFPPLGDLPKPGMEPASIATLALAGRFFTNYTTWGDHNPSKINIHEHIWASATAHWVKNPPSNAGDIRDMGSIPESGRSPGGRNGNPLQFSCWDHPMNRGARPATVQRVTESDTIEQPGMHTNTH